MAITTTEDSATIGSTEYSCVNDSTTIAASTTAGVYQVYLDLANLALGDVYELRIKEKPTASSTQATILKATFNGPVADACYASVSLMLVNGWDVTLKKIAGIDRAIGWSLRKA